MFKAYYERGLFEGTALIADSTGIVYHNAFGIANRGSGIRNDTTTIFRLGLLRGKNTGVGIDAAFQIKHLTRNDKKVRTIADELKHLQVRKIEI